MKLSYRTEPTGKTFIAVFRVQKMFQRILTADLRFSNGFIVSLGVDKIDTK